MQAIQLVMADVPPEPAPSKGGCAIGAGAGGLGVVLAVVVGLVLARLRR